MDLGKSLENLFLGDAICFWERNWEKFLRVVERKRGEAVEKEKF